MKLGFALFKYFPFGGLQRDMLAIARACVDRGHTVSVFCGDWEGEQPDYVDVHRVPMGGFSNHRRDASFAAALPAVVERVGVDALVGFNKMPCLDYYYAADSCFAAKICEERGFYYRFLPRARQYRNMEAAVFEADSATRVLLISAPELTVYQRYYHTPDSRLRLLPPGIRRDRVMGEDYAQRRTKMREEQGWAEDEKIVLFVGSGFRTKGLDRAIRACADLSERGVKSRMLVLGKDRPARFEALAIELGVGQQIEFRGGVDNVSDYLWAADVLLHPAYRENTGTVLLEAMVAGLPVVTTDACGYQRYVREAGMGEVVTQPVHQTELNEALHSVLASEAGIWRERGRTFAGSADIFSLPERAAELLEHWQ